MESDEIFRRVISRTRPCRSARSGGCSGTATLARFHMHTSSGPGRRQERLLPGCVDPRNAGHASSQVCVESAGQAVENDRNPLKLLVPGRGLEPPRCYSLVPETSASTNSATRAGCEERRKVRTTL